MKNHKRENSTGKNQQGFRPKRKNTMMAPVMKFFQDEDGASALEYVLLAAFLTSVAITVGTSLGGVVSSSFFNTAELVDAVN